MNGIVYSEAEVCNCVYKMFNKFLRLRESRVTRIDGKSTFASIHGYDNWDKERVDGKEGFVSR